MRSVKLKCLKPYKIYIPDDEKGTYEPMLCPCGKCEVCRKSDASDWRIRLMEEFYDSHNAYFATLTYNDDKLPFSLGTDEFGKDHIYATFKLLDIQKFVKRIRKKYQDYYKKTGLKLVYFIVSEYGPTTLRPHYHGLFFNLPKLSDIKEIQDKKINEEMEKIWSNGYVNFSECNIPRIAYCTKYMSCQSVIPFYFKKPFRVMSKGIGKAYLNRKDRIKWHKEHIITYYPDGAFKIRLPRYYKDKIFSEDEKIIIKQLLQLYLEEEKQKYVTNWISHDIDFVKFVKDGTWEMIEKKIFEYKVNYQKKYLKKRKDL